MWKPVENFDRDVKKGIKIKLDSSDYEYVVTGVGDDFFLARMVSPCFHRYEQTYDKKGKLLQVWREPARFRAELNKLYWYVDSDGDLVGSQEMFDSYSETNFKLGNYFRTEEMAQEYADECKKVAMRLHEKWGE